MAHTSSIDPALRRSLVRLIMGERRLVRASTELADRLGGEDAAVARHAAHEAERRGRRLAASLPDAPDTAPKGSLEALVPVFQGRLGLRLLVRMHDDQIKRIHQVLERADGSVYESIMEMVLLPCVRVRRHLAERTAGRRWGGDLAPALLRRAP